MSTSALELAREQRKAMKKLGILPTKNVKFSGTDKVACTVGGSPVTLAETELIKLAAKRNGQGMVEYVRAVVFAQAIVDAAKPVKVRTERTIEQLDAEIAKLEKRKAERAAAQG